MKADFNDVLGVSKDADFDTIRSAADDLDALVRRAQAGTNEQLALDNSAIPAEIRGALLLSFAIGSDSAALPALHWAEPILARAKS
jgi:hypothetical protein